MDNLIRLPAPERRIRQRRNDPSLAPEIGQPFVQVLHRMLGLRLVWINPNPVGKR
ncbi:MAG: hypothetical protein HQL34_14145 [Alphaproteobacteria bacterium]|nr:hypothetical protein [Alphaproteobacteria bacterium]